MGPTGIMVMMGEVPPQEIYKGFMEQARGLADGGVDGIVMETMTDPEEARLAIEAIKKVRSGCGLYLYLFQDPGWRIPDHDGHGC